jgi:hypothetical protein
MSHQSACVIDSVGDLEPASQQPDHLSPGAGLPPGKHP